MSIAVVTDSTSDITKEIGKRFGVTIVPLTATIDGETFVDGELTQAEFFERMNAAPMLPTTSQPSVGAFVEVYEEVLEKASHIVSVHVSSHLSGTIDSAREAAKQFAGRVHVIDSLNLSWGLGLQVLEAAKAAASGVDIDGVIARVEDARDRVRLIVGLDRMDNLVKGGRVGRLTGYVGGILNLKVMLTVEEGTFSPVGRHRGARVALDRTMDWIDVQMKGKKRGVFCVMHAMSEERALKLKDRILARFEAVEMYVVEVGGSISTHTGTGWGIAVLPEA